VLGWAKASLARFAYLTLTVQVTNGVVNADYVIHAHVGVG
jgi:hypothetical protein